MAQFTYVRDAIDTHADLSAFRGPPPLKVIGGVLLICLSFAMCWPVIGTLGGVSIYFGQPLIVAVGGPIIYGLSHLVFLAGMALSGEKYLRLFLKWATRKGVERLLACGDVAKPAVLPADAT